MTLKLADSIPTPIIIDFLGEGISSSSCVQSIWEDTNGYVHFLNTFGGSTTAVPWSGIHTNSHTGTPALITGCVGQARRILWHPPSQKIYGVTHYANPGNFWQFDPSTGVVTVLVDTLHSHGIQPIVGDDNKVYFMDIGYNAWSCDPANSNAIKSYGAIPFTSGNEYASLGCDGTTFYAAGKISDDDGGTYQLFSCPVSGTTWTGWAHNASGDKVVTIDQWRPKAAPTTFVWFVYRKDDSDNEYYYTMSGSTFTPADPANYYYPISYQHVKLHTPFLATQEQDQYGWWLEGYGYTADYSDLAPIRGNHEFARFGYRVGDTGAYTYVTENYTGPWDNLALVTAIPNADDTLFASMVQYTATLNTDYLAETSDYLGSQAMSTYYCLRLSDNRIVMGGYSSLVWVYDQGAAWTLATTSQPGDATNPKLLVINPPILHYRHRLAEDANGLLWIGGNTTRESPDYGNVCWYNLDTDALDYVADDFQASGIEIRDMISATNGSIICVSDNQGQVWFIDAATKTKDSSPLVVAASGGNVYMVEIATDLVFGLLLDNGTTGIKKFTFKPSTKQIISALAAPGVSGIPFGSGTSTEDKRLRNFILGPDGWPWLYMDNNLYRVDPSDLGFELIYSDNRYRRLTFGNGGHDLVGILSNFDGGEAKVAVWQDVFITELLTSSPLGIEGGQPGGIIGGKVDGI